MEKDRLIETLEALSGSIENARFDIDNLSIGDASTLNESSDLLSEADDYVRKVIDLIESIEDVYTILPSGEIIDGECTVKEPKLVVTHEVLEIIARESDRLTFGMHKAVSHLRSENKMLKQFIDDNATEKVEV